MRSCGADRQQYIVEGEGDARPERKIDMALKDVFTAENLKFFWLFAMPGILIVYFRSLFLTGRMPPIAEAAIGYVALSVAYHGLLFPLADWVYGQPIEGVYGAVRWMLYVVVGPIIVGALLGLSIQQGWSRKACEFFAIRPVHSIATAWDWKFSSAKSSFVLIVLKDDTKWAGYLGDGSFISSMPTERDIFVEQVYKIDADENWIKRTSGVWISGSEIRSIEIWPEGEL